MVDGTYAVEVDTPLGRKAGMVTLATNGDKLTAEVDAPIIGKRTVKGTADGDTFSAHGSVKLKLLGTFECTVEGEVHGDDIAAMIRTNKGDFSVVGVRV